MKKATEVGKKAQSSFIYSHFDWNNRMENGEPSTKKMINYDVESWFDREEKKEYFEFVLFVAVDQLFQLVKTKYSKHMEGRVE